MVLIASDEEYEDSHVFFFSIYIGIEYGCFSEFTQELQIWRQQF